jgi:hypothetical protein
MPVFDAIDNSNLAIDMKTSRPGMAAGILPYTTASKTPASNAKTPQFMKTFIAHG